MWLGVDPGGDGNFGLAWLTVDGQVETHCVSSVDEALALVRVQPTAVGIDAPLWWSSGRGGGRRADEWIRRTYEISGGTVQSVNSLRGACIVPGPHFLDLLRKRYPGVAATEVHPKAVVIAAGTWEKFRVEHSLDDGKYNLHERDALIAAVAAREGFQGRWNRDLSLKR